MIKLPKDTYKRDLLHWFFSLNVGDCDQEEYELLKKVCTCYIYNGRHNFQIDRIKITDIDKVLIQERDYIHSENKEIRARFIDVAIRSGLYKKNKLELKRECSDLYLEIAEQQKDCFAFVRAVQFILELRFRTIHSVRKHGLNYLTSLINRQVTQASELHEWKHHAFLRILLFFCLLHELKVFAVSQATWHIVTLRYVPLLLIPG